MEPSESKDSESTRPIVLVTHKGVPRAGINLLQSRCEVRMVESLPPKREEILQKCQGVHAILWGYHDELNTEVLDAAGPQLKAISTMSVGLDFVVCVEELKARGILLGYTPQVANGAVSTLAVGLLIASARKFREARINMEAGEWDKLNPIQWLLGCDIRGATVGFFGFGGIAQNIAKRLTGFDVGKFIYCTRNKSLKESDFKATHVGFDELCKESDIIFVTCPLTSETKHKFDANAFNKMKSSCVFVNVARGLIVDQNALVDALMTHKIFAAGLDVMYPEPLPKTNPLLRLPNCFLTPHLGTATRRTRDNMSIVAAHNILRALDGEQMFASAY